MSNVINRTTLEYKVSVDTPEYPEEDWIINPDLSSVESIPKEYWKIVQDDVLEMDQAEKDQVDLNNLPALKDSRFMEIDAKTCSLLLEGFSFDNVYFSLSLAAQTNWNTLKNSQTDFIWPVSITTIDNDTYILTQSNLGAFWSAGRDKTKDHLDSGRVLKKQIKDATTKAEVDSVVDNR
jgi:hypothetical protein